MRSALAFFDLAARRGLRAGVLPGAALVLLVFGWTTAPSHAPGDLSLAALRDQLEGAAILTLLGALAWAGPLRATVAMVRCGGRLGRRVRSLVAHLALLLLVCVLAWTMFAGILLLSATGGASSTAQTRFRESLATGPSEPLDIGAGSGWQMIRIPHGRVAPTEYQGGGVDLPVRIHPRILLLDRTIVREIEVEVLASDPRGEPVPPRRRRFVRGEALLVDARCPNPGSPGEVEIRLRVLSEGVVLRIEPDSVRLAGKPAAWSSALLRLLLLAAGAVGALGVFGLALSAVVRTSIALIATFTLGVAVAVLRPDLFAAVWPGTWTTLGLVPGWVEVGKPWLLAALAAFLLAPLGRGD